ncbi:dual specificity protein phosphatase 1-like isoform X1 [Mytilus trossulus]|uniref:dual specificity protein phosphatase 1-like isoform X1 n=2 Tax=Mytilus trossulus TaxID=6551 RepID=UPI003007A130
MKMNFINSYTFFNNLEQHLSESTDNILLIDTRSYLSYNEDHIIGACNVYCPPILKRRVRNGGKIRLESMLGCEIQNKLKTGQIGRIYMYDDGTYLQNGDEMSDMFIVWTSMCKLVNSKNCFILQSSFKEFQKTYPHLCQTTDYTQVHDTTVEMDKACRRALYRTDSTQSEPIMLKDYLYIGNSANASCKEEMINLGITAILNVSNTCQNHFCSDFRYKTIAVEDDGSTDLAKWFREAIQFIDNEKYRGGKTMVHCHAGISRSATICLAYIMYNEKIDLNTAFEYVKSRKHEISPNLSFMQQLLTFEKEVLCKTPTPVSPCRSCSVPAGFSFYNFGNLSSPVLVSPTVDFT